MPALIFRDTPTYGLLWRRLQERAGNLMLRIGDQMFFQDIEDYVRANNNTPEVVINALTSRDVDGKSLVEVTLQKGFVCSSCNIIENLLDKGAEVDASIINTATSLYVEFVRRGVLDEVIQDEDQINPYSLAFDSIDKCPENVALCILPDVKQNLESLNNELPHDKTEILLQLISDKLTLVRESAEQWIQNRRNGNVFMV